MNKFYFLFKFFFIMSHCSEKITYADVAPQLEIIVKTETGQLVSRAQVSLFETEDDWINKTNIVQSGETDGQGCILFSDLDEIKYYFLAVKNSMTNRNEVSETNEVLKVNVKAIVETTIK